MSLVIIMIHLCYIHYFSSLYMLQSMSKIRPFINSPIHVSPALKQVHWFDLHWLALCIQLHFAKPCPPHTDSFWTAFHRPNLFFIGCYVVDAAQPMRTQIKLRPTVTLLGFLNTCTSVNITPPPPPPTTPIRFRESHLSRLTRGIGTVTWLPELPISRNRCLCLCQQSLWCYFAS